MPELSRELGRRWALLAADARAPYELESRRAKERFEEEMRSYTLLARVLVEESCGRGRHFGTAGRGGEGRRGLPGLPPGQLAG